jgi:urease accessory protein UreF
MSANATNAERLAAATELTGDFAALVEQLGSVPEGAEAGLRLLREGQPVDPAEVPAVLAAYAETLLQPVELPAILQAWQFARNGQARELIELDRRFGRDARMRPFALASVHAGRNQLRRLRPLRDEKVIQRYLAAIEAGEASGWHTLVYGLTLAVYSLPPREGMLAYAQQTLRSLAARSARGGAASEVAVLQAVETGVNRVPAVINALLSASGLEFAPSVVRSA